MIKKYSILLPIIFTVPLFSDHTQQMIEHLRHYNDPHTILLSYPRSGNTWLRYCLEYLTHRPSFKRIGLDNIQWDFGLNRPLAWRSGFEIDITKPPIEKAHQRRDLDSSNTHPDNKLILLVRNPKETIKRNEYALITKKLLQGREARVQPTLCRASTYFDDFAIYDSWDSEKRILVYYEDLLTQPRQELTRILIFLQEPLTRLDDFMDDYDTHKKKSLELYRDGESQVEDLLFHSKEDDPVYRKQVDQWIEELYPEWWKKYLKDHYAENVLKYIL